MLVQMVLLRNGAEHPTRLVWAISSRLEDLQHHHGFVFVELVEACRDQMFRLGEDALKVLIEKDLATSDGPLCMTRDVVLSMIEGEGLEMTFGNPIA